MFWHWIQYQEWLKTQGASRLDVEKNMLQLSGFLYKILFLINTRLPERNLTLRATTVSSWIQITFPTGLAANFAFYRSFWFSTAKIQTICSPKTKSSVNFISNPLGGRFRHSSTLMHYARPWTIQELEKEMCNLPKPPAVPNWRGMR